MLSLTRRFAALALVLVAVATAAFIATDAEPAGAQTGGPTGGAVLAFGNAAPVGPPAGYPFNQPVVAIEGTIDAGGYWLAASDGGIFTYGNAPFFGSAGALPLNQPVVDMARTPSGNGYWMVASDGGIFTYGDAGFFGSTGSLILNQPIVSMTPTKSGNGYWLFAADGGVFSFGDAPFLGSLGDVPLVAPIVGATALPTAEGYWLVSRDGGIFSFGNAPFYGSLGGEADIPLVAVASTLTGKGYYLVDEQSGVYSFGDAFDHGSGTEDGAVGPAVDIAPTSDGYWIARMGVTLIDPNASGPLVTALQHQLTNLGFWLGAADGNYGDLTTQAVVAFQKWSGLPRTGAVDAQTSVALNRAQRPTVRSTAGLVIEIDLAKQLFFVVRDGRVEWVVNTSTGSGDWYTNSNGQRQQAITPTGDFRVGRSFDGWEESKLGQLYRPRYFIDSEGIAVHGYPRVPSFPASHGCTRVSLPFMDLIWDANLMPRGTRVLVY